MVTFSPKRINPVAIVEVLVVTSLLIDLQSLYLPSHMTILKVNVFVMVVEDITFYANKHHYFDEDPSLLGVLRMV